MELQESNNQLELQLKNQIQNLQNELENELSKKSEIEGQKAQLVKDIEDNQEIIKTLENENKQLQDGQTSTQEQLNM
jgi:uncharacterized membrane-anchored protein YhcB (DUF1043 family)